jgi:hypothetical protein
MVRNRDLVTNADLQQSRTNAATGETKSCNAKMESAEDFGQGELPLTGQPVQPVQRPGENPGQLGGQLLSQ